MAQIDLAKELTKEIDLDTTPILFGKFKHYTPEEVLEEDASYLKWAYENLSPKFCSRTLYIIACMELEEEEENGRDLQREWF